VLLDVTAQRRAEAALAESEARLKLFIERAPAAIAMFDTEMRYLAVSRRFLSSYNLASRGDPASLIGRSHYELFPDIPDRWREIHRRVLTGEVLSAEQDAFPRADGRTDWVRWEMAPWRRVDGSVGGVLLFSEVVTARIETERAGAETAARLRLALDAADLGTWH
jgi:PAS domain S-box-containing protein